MFDTLQSAPQIDPVLSGPYEHIRMHHRAMMALIASAPEKMFTAVAPGKWSPAQIMTHVHYSFIGSLAYLHKKLQYPDTIKKNRIAAWFRMRALLFILRSDIRTKAPIAIARDPENKDMESLEKQWQKIEADLERLLQNFPPALLHKNTFRHPFVGRITIGQTLLFLDAHMQHHARQIQAFLRA